jgi:hypothetical protein
MKKLILGALILTAFGASSLFAQSSATQSTTASARVLAKIQLAKLTDLNFGDLVAGAAAGTVVVDIAGARTSTGGVSLAAGTVSQASFTVTGEPNKSYTITVPASVTLNSGANTMAVNTFVLNPVTPATIPVGGTQPLNIGATLNVGANQATGSYTNTFNVVVAYN